MLQKKLINRHRVAGWLLSSWHLFPGLSSVTHIEPTRSRPLASVIGLGRGNDRQQANQRGKDLLLVDPSESENPNACSQVYSLLGKVAGEACVSAKENAS